MPLIEGVGDEVTHFFIVLGLLLILCIAWWTTSISEQPHIRTVFLLDRRIRRRSYRHRLSSHIESTTIAEGTHVEEVPSRVENTETLENSASVQPYKPPETNSSEDLNGSGDSNSRVEEEERDEIVRIMDANTNVVRQRRLAFYENRQNVNTSNSSREDIHEMEASTSLHECTNDRERSSVSNLVVDKEASEDQLMMEHNYAERDVLKLDTPTDVDKQQNDTENEASSSKATQSSSNSEDSNIRIKLKYINDELKLVHGRLEEQLGDFKRRHFEGELSSNKLVRLIFNGQVLQQDTETLQAYGLFDNCVVHCLVHQRRLNPSDTRGTESSNIGSSTSNNNNNQGRDWDLGNLFFAFVSFILGSAWYFRYEYAHLYTVTATVALVAITGIFTVVLIGMYFPDTEQQQTRAEGSSPQS